jgi:hypothetical protein
MKQVCHILPRTNHKTKNNEKYKTAQDLGPIAGSQPKMKTEQTKLADTTYVMDSAMQSLRIPR